MGYCEIRCEMGELHLLFVAVLNKNMFDSEGFALFTELFFSQTATSAKGQHTTSNTSLLSTPSLPLLSPFSSQLSKGSYAESFTVAARRGTQWQKRRHAFITSVCMFELLSLSLKDAFSFHMWHGTHLNTIIKDTAPLFLGIPATPVTPRAGYAWK